MPGILKSKTGLETRKTTSAIYVSRDCTSAVFRMTHKHYLEGQVYSVPLIQPDLRREEAVHQIADALLYLETISTDIFRRQERTFVFYFNFFLA